MTETKTAAAQILEAETKGNAKAEAERKSLQAMIEAAAVVDPSLKDRLTVAAVWQYWRLPDKSFGWSDAGPMPAESKAICIITTLSLGLMPGVGHVLWLGNSAYVTADARRFLANADRELVKTGKAIRRALNAEEKEMYDVREGDRAMIIEQPVTFRGTPTVWEGLGILGADEPLENKWGKPMPGRGSTKDRAMTLITRAERDMLKRNYPLGVADYEDRPPPALDVAHEDRTPALEAAVAKVDTAERDAVLVRFDAAVQRVKERDGVPSDILEVNAGAFRLDASADNLGEAAGILERWIKDHEPDPTPPAGGAKPKGKAGRPTKEQAAAKAAAEAEEAARAATSMTIPAGTVLPPGAVSGEVVYVDDDAEAEAEFARALAGDPEPVEAPITPTARPAPAAAAFAAPPGAVVDAGQPTPRELELDAHRKARARLEAAVARAQKLAPLRSPMQLTGTNHHNLLDPDKRPSSAGTIAMIALAELLEGWDGVGPTPLEQSTAASDARAAKTSERRAAAAPPPAAGPGDDAPPLGDPAPVAAAAPPAAKRHRILDMIDATLANPNTPTALHGHLRELAACDFRDGDQNLFPRAFREAKEGKLGELVGLIAARRRKV